MPDHSQDIQRHYSHGNLLTRILDALTASDKDIAAMKVDDLYGIDQMHIGGVMATRKLATRASTCSDDKVLDVGCGIGGTSRLLASELGCRVTGIDLTEEYCRVAADLTDRTGLASLVRFQAANALDTPFENAHFTQIWCQHINMNIADKEGLLREMARVLKPGGKLILHEIFSGDHQPIRYPVPWAPSESISHLCSCQEYRDRLRALGLKELYRHNHSDEALSWWENRAKAIRNNNINALGPQVIFGKSAPEFGPNLIHNLRSDAIRVFEMIWEKPSSTVNVNA